MIILEACVNLEKGGRLAGLRVGLWVVTWLMVWALCTIAKLRNHPSFSGIMVIPGHVSLCIRLTCICLLSCTLSPGCCLKDGYWKIKFQGKFQGHGNFVW